jgi:hypothetical protein
MASSDRRTRSDGGGRQQHRADPTATAGLFDLLSDETRVRIVAALYRHWQRSPADPCLPFSVLRERVDAADSGRFNYHLGRLRGALVRECADGYTLSPLGVCLGQFVAEGGPASLDV